VEQYDKRMKDMDLKMNNELPDLTSGMVRSGVKPLLSLPDTQYSNSDRSSLMLTALQRQQASLPVINMKPTIQENSDSAMVDSQMGGMVAVQEHAHKRWSIAKQAAQVINDTEIERQAQRQQIASPIVQSQSINHAVLHNNVNDTNVTSDLSTHEVATKRQRVSADTVAVVEPATAAHDAKFQDMKDTYSDIFKHPPRGRYASDSEWLTSKIALGCHQQSALPSAAAVVPTEASTVSTIALTLDVIMPRFGRMMRVGLTMIDSSL
jgi:hypothetical protein